MTFFVHHTDHLARTGVLATAHGEIRTPAFMPVGTAATVKGMTPEAVLQTGADTVLGNTYHLMLRPGAERIARLGGLHKFMHWDKPILTDSGGFQVMSLAKLRNITEEGVTFQSHLDGSTHMLTPERSIEIQHLLGSDITMVFDECTPYPATEAEAAASMRLSMRWAERSKHAFFRLHSPLEGESMSRRRIGGGEDGGAITPPHDSTSPVGSSRLLPLQGGANLLFGIVQGGVHPALREESCNALLDIGFDGYAIGGLAVGEGQELMFSTLDATMPFLPEDKPRYLMGVGMPDDMLGAVMRGVDMFDCVIPTRAGRNARAYTRFGEMNLRNARYTEDPAPLDAGCTCPACTHYSRAYLHHLFNAKEMLGAMLLTHHNLHYYQTLMQEIREAIAIGNLEALAVQLRTKWCQNALPPTLID